MGNIVLGIKLSKIGKNSESELVVLFNEYGRTTHQTIQNNNHFNEIKDEIKEILFRYTNEFPISTIDVYCKEGNAVYKEYADEITYYNTIIDVIKNIVTEVQ